MKAIHYIFHFAMEIRGFTIHSYFFKRAKESSGLDWWSSSFERASEIAWFASKRGKHRNISSPGSN